jgi:hypothetical protein
MNILMVSALDVWSLADGKGAPSLYRTLRAYGEAGHSVYFVAPTVGANHFGPPSKEAPPPPQIPNVEVIRFHSQHQTSAAAMAGLRSQGRSKAALCRRVPVACRPARGSNSPRA